MTLNIENLKSFDKISKRQNQLKYDTIKEELTNSISNGEVGGGHSNDISPRQLVTNESADSQESQKLDDSFQDYSTSQNPQRHMSKHSGP